MASQHEQMRGVHKLVPTSRNALVKLVIASQVGGMKMTTMAERYVPPHIYTVQH